MTDEQLRAYIDAAVKNTVAELKRSGLLRREKSIAYEEAADLLRGYYRDGKQDNGITYAIQGLRFDPYFRIIAMYFEEGKTNEQIAAELDCDVSTIMRNKRRLCLKIYDEVV